MRAYFSPEGFWWYVSLVITHIVCIWDFSAQKSIFLILILSLWNVEPFLIRSASNTFFVFYLKKPSWWESNNRVICCRAELGLTPIGFATYLVACLWAFTWVPQSLSFLISKVQVIWLWAWENFGINTFLVFDIKYTWPGDPHFQDVFLICGSLSKALPRMQWFSGE